MVYKDKKGFEWDNYDVYCRWKQANKHKLKVKKKKVKPDYDAVMRKMFG